MISIGQWNPGDLIMLCYTVSLVRLCLCPEEWSLCQRPVRLWLMVSHIIAISLRAPQHVRRLSVFQGGPTDVEAEGSPLWKAASSWALVFVWCGLLPFHCIWTILGSVWLSGTFRNDAECLPASFGGTGFALLWQALSYAWVAIYAGSLIVAWQLRKRLQQANQDLSEIVDADVQLRWGDRGLGSEAAPMTGIAGLMELAQASEGLTPTEIRSLPLLQGAALDEPECSICLSQVEENDEVRKLPICGHTFHRACIDLWLLRQNACPLCKGHALNCKSHPGEDDCSIP